MWASFFGCKDCGFVFAHDMDRVQKQVQQAANNRKIRVALVEIFVHATVVA
ncbi:hypothetical protein B4079_1854 [Bacillus cereus]|nr:hypothetical protein B4079_1854 [Bacillus cereus]